jgi:DNA-binding protein YbaB
MADLDDLNIKSILDMSNDEGIENLRQIRLNRRTPVKQAKIATTGKKAVTKVKIDPSVLSDADKLELLKLLGES